MMLSEYLQHWFIWQMSVQYSTASRLNSVIYSGTSLPRSCSGKGSFPRHIKTSTHKWKLSHYNQTLREIHGSRENGTRFSSPQQTTFGASMLVTTIQTHHDWCKARILWYQHRKLCVSSNRPSHKRTHTSDPSKAYPVQLRCLAFSEYHHTDRLNHSLLEGDSTKLLSVQPKSLTLVLYTGVEYLLGCPCKSPSATFTYREYMYWFLCISVVPAVLLMPMVV